MQLDFIGNKMVFLFWSIQIYNFVMLHLTYKELSTYFYLGYFIIAVLLPLISMVIARILLGFILLIYNNQELIKTIKRILEVFPEGIIIQSFDKETKWLVIKFTNDAAKEIINYDDPWENPIDDAKLNYVLKFDESIKELDELDQSNIKSKGFTLSEFLQFQKEAVNTTQKEKSCAVELWESSKNSKNKYYSVKTLRVKWENNSNSYIHVFNNMTTLK